MELLTVNETAKMLRVSPITIRRYIASGQLPAVKVGKGVRVRKESVEPLVKPIEPKLPKRVRRGRLFTKDDALFDLIGIAEGPTDGATDVSENKYKYLAEAYATKNE